MNLFPIAWRFFPGLCLASLVWVLAETRAAELRLPTGFRREVLAGPELPEPMDLATAPDRSVWVTGRAGQVWRVDPESRSQHLVGRVVTDTAGDRGLHGLALHPDFETTGEIFVFYHAPRHPPGRYLSRVSRWKVSGHGTGAALVPDSEKVLLEFEGNEGGQHVGGGLLAHPPDNLLYVTTGDNNVIWELKQYCDDPKNQAQSPGDLRGKVLRIGFDGSIPGNNPFTATKGARGEVFTLGHRQPWALSWDPPTGWILLAENGGDEVDDHEEVNRIEPGANYGWPKAFADGLETRSRTNRVPGIRAPWFHYVRNTGGSCTGALIYRPQKQGTNFPDRFAGGLFYSDYNRKSVRFVPVDSASGTPGTAEPFAQFLPGGPVALRLGADGALYLAEYGGWFGATTNDAISRIVWKP
ncbi:MAG: PQQ-dependent sugar dehydrogenase [Verrucomicrobiales bacterium]|nr:PQQ-dependent sugar dehydrogenase [Verrucomicrobiales bacterium]